MKQWLVGTDNAMLLVNGMEFTSDISKATQFNKIGDAMRECIRLNNIEFDYLMQTIVLHVQWKHEHK